MALSFAEVFAAARDDATARINCSVATLQTNHVCMHSSIQGLRYKPSGSTGRMRYPEQISTDGYEGQALFSDRRTLGGLGDGLPTPDPHFSGGPSAFRLTLYLGFARGRLGVGFGPSAKLRFRDESQSISIPLEPQGDLMVGFGPAIKNSAGDVFADHALFTFALSIHQTRI